MAIAAERATGVKKRVVKTDAPRTTAIANTGFAVKAGAFAKV